MEGHPKPAIFHEWKTVEVPYEGLIMLRVYDPEEGVSEYEIEAVFDTPENAEVALERIEAEYPEMVRKVFIGAAGRAVHAPRG